MRGLRPTRQGDLANIRNAASSTEEAYARIAALKVSPKDSFSKVILRVVPKRGTGAQLLAGAAQLPPLTDQQVRVMEEATARNNDWKHWRDPWTSS